MHLPEGYVLLNRYRIEKVLGQGGFGKTYRVFDLALNHHYCLKELFVSGSSTRGANQTVNSEEVGGISFADFKAKFIREAQELAKFNHPGIVKVLNVFEANNTAYYVMEYVEGVTLEDKVRSGGALPRGVAIEVMRQLLEGVEAVHRKGMLHRDIKPSNVLIDADGRVTLIDFGSAREFEDGKTVTHTAYITDGYSPIEQYSNRASRAVSSDIYALGATMYFLLTGIKPLSATDRVGEVLKAPHEVNFQIDSQLSSAVMLAMQMRAEDRFQTVGDFRSALQLLSQEGQSGGSESAPPAPPSGAAPRRRKVLIAVFVALIATFLVLLMNYVVNYVMAEDVEHFQYETVWVSGGTFTMGCTSQQGDDCYDDEEPSHRVTVSSFEMGKYEVTQAQWRAVMGSNPSNFNGCDNCPVEYVSWNDVQDFIHKLNGQSEGKYRLPTEAEWEFAARGGNQSYGNKYAGGDWEGSVAWYSSNSGDRPHQVGLKQANELGIYDMSGNVWEWCEDWYGAYSGSSQTNPQGPQNGSFRVLRGGSWDSDARYCRVSNRGDIGSPTDRDYRYGFRLVFTFSP